MKKIFLLLCFFSIAFSQEEECYQPEIYVSRKNKPQNAGSLTVYMDRVSKAYSCSLKTLQDSAIFFIGGNNCSEEIHCCNAGKAVINDSGKRGWDISYDNNLVTEGRYGYGVYKINEDYSNKYFYIDFREMRYGATHYYNYFLPDAYIEYDYSTQKFLFKLTSNTEYDSLINGEFIQIWKYRGFSKPKIDSFPQYWTNCLANIEQPFDSIPRLSLVYGPHPTMSNVTEYYIYRAVNTSDSTNENNYSFYGRTADSVFLFNDLSVRTDIISEAPRFYYFIKAKNSGGLSSKTNIVVMQGAIEWSNALSIINDNNNPRLNWGPNTDEYEIVNYKVYRALVTKNSSPPSENSYNLIYTTSNSTTYTYKDEEVAYGSTYDVYYYIKATKSDNSLSDRTNIEKIVGTLVKRGLEANAKEYALSQNYPNPFNPTTSINYEIPTSPSFPLLEGEGGRERFVTS